MGVDDFGGGGPPRTRSVPTEKMIDPRVNPQKMQFMLQYILNARLSGRSIDCDSENARWRLVQSADDLYTRVQDKCRV